MRWRWRRPRTWTRWRRRLPRTCLLPLLPLLLLGCVTALPAGGVAATVPAQETTRDDDVGAMARARQWQLSLLRLPEAWRTSRGEGVLVAVLDTGVRAHPDLGGVVVQGPDLTGAARTGGMWGHHGTAMASLIAGRGHGPGLGVIGVAPAARVLSVRVTLESADPRRELLRSGGRHALARGIRYAVDHGADVISMSLGGGSGAWEGAAAEEEAVQYAFARGVVLVASSGNDGDTTNRKTFPAAYPGVIAVGAVDSRLRPARFSNRRDYLSVVAPGTGIVTASAFGDYVVGDGTSSAAAMVAGIAALIRSAHPDLSPFQVRRAIERGTRQRPPGGYDSSYGHGVANAVLALREAGRLAVTPPLPGGGSGAAGAAPPPRAHFGDGPPAEPPASRMAVVVGMVLLAAGMSARVVGRQRRRCRDLT
ncbi:S8 family serine peptidase [Nonomuraea glycinis]|uniref:S8 family serine peptidase n=1 Tax=Nonomuraea glycinis TaxID=2047744 RepID=UPI002E10B124|nr:S8 family serine peptidase [Nonomuraea glycinis]